VQALRLNSFLQVKMAQPLSEEEKQQQARACALDLSANAFAPSALTPYSSASFYWMKPTLRVCRDRSCACAAVACQH
jgi:hypothetical protein